MKNNHPAQAKLRPNTASAEEPAAEVDVDTDANSLNRWIPKGQTTTYLDNKVNFEKYDQILARACAEVAKVPLLLEPLLDSVKHIGIDREKIQGIQNYVERKYKEKDLERLRATVAKRVYAYRPDIEQLDGMIKFLGPYLDPEKKLRVQRHLGSAVAIRYAAPVLEQVTADARAVLDQIVPANIKLVLGELWKYQNRGLPSADIIQEGTIGLYKAAQRFEISRGFQFPTYAGNWITQSILRAIAEQAREIRIPVHMSEFISKVSKTDRRLREELDRAPAAEEIADELDADVKKVRLALRARDSTVSLDAPVGTDGEDALVKDFIRDEKALDPGCEAALSVEREKIMELIHALSPREQEVMKSRFGLENRPVLTLEELGKIYRVTRERIRQIEAKCLRKLRPRVEKMQRMNVD